MLRSMDSFTSPLLSSPLPPIRVYVKKGPWRGGHLVLPFVGNHCHFFTCTCFVLCFFLFIFKICFTKTSYLLNANQPYFKTFFIN